MTKNRKTEVLEGEVLKKPPQKHYKPTEADTERVKILAKHCRANVVAKVLGLPERTFWRHFGDLYQSVWANRVADIGEKMLEKADQGDTVAMKFVLERYGDWKQRNELTGPDGGPLQMASVDLTQYLTGRTDEELEAIGELLENLAAAGGASVADSGEGSAEAA